MSWLIAIAGFCALIVAHEAGHFAAAKLVGMRVERFSLFFPPKLLSVRRGETEYMLGALPLGGYVKITGMSPEELRDTDLRLAERSYYMKAPWKRIFVILAGPAVNIVIAFVLFAIVLGSGSLDGSYAIGQVSSQQTVHFSTSRYNVVAAVTPAGGASGVLRVGDTLLRVNGAPITTRSLRTAVAGTHCAGAQVAGCRATQSVTLTIRRAGRVQTFAITPRYDAQLRRMLVGISYGPTVRATSVIHRGVIGTLGTSAAVLWDVSTTSITHYIDALTSSKVRGQLQSIVGITQDTQQAVVRGPGFALVVLALISLVLAVVNLFPFLPLDGGHVLWSIAEKLRGRRVSVISMWRFSSVGIVALAFLVISGVSNDLSRLGA
jgi:regulator of sigma E protease